MCHQTQNTNKKLEIVKKKQIEKLELETKNSLDEFIVRYNTHVRRQKKE